jgi:Ca2+-transporting ATPase
LEIESNLTYLATFGLEDDLRVNVRDSVHTIKFGTKDVYGEDTTEERDLSSEVNIRMLSGDHIDTCRNIAIQAGIISASEAFDEGVVITAEQFREQIGQIQMIWESNNNNYIIEFMEGRQKFDAAKNKCKVIARCTSKDKFIFVSGIKQKGGLVGMTGKTISDSEALKRADVGFCMGSGCDVAKDSSDLVLLNDEFQSIHTSIKWGRSIFDNVRKFLQFQLTINIVICIITIIGGSTTGIPPLNVIQMLWVNLMMDILGAISIATEPYRKDVVEQVQKRISRKDTIVRPEMYRQIGTQAIYQLLVMLFLMYIGPFIFFEESYNLVSEPLMNGTVPTNRLVMNTICFYTFFTMNWFNTFNCRLVDKDENNIFNPASIFNNKLFWIIMIIELVVQLFMMRMSNTAVGSALFGIAPLTPMQELTCWIIGFMCIPLNVVFKKIPLSTFAWFNFDLEDDKKISKIDRYMDKY